MSKNNKKTYIFIALFFSFVIITSFSWRKSLQISAPIIGKNVNAQTVMQSATILAGDTTTHLQFAPDTLFYDALVHGKNNGKITFDGKNYPGLGFFVTDIGTLHAGGGKDLIYYTNGKEANVGVSSYTLKDGDIIEWKLE